MTDRALTGFRYCICQRQARSCRRQIRSCWQPSEFSRSPPARWFRSGGQRQRASCFCKAAATCCHSAGRWRTSMRSHAASKTASIRAEARAVRRIISAQLLPEHMPNIPRDGLGRVYDAGIFDVVKLIAPLTHRPDDVLCVLLLVQGSRSVQLYVQPWLAGRKQLTHSAKHGVLHPFHVDLH